MSGKLWDNATILRKCSVLRIASYNVKNLFGPDAEYPKPAHELRALLREIDKLSADVLVLQEVGGADALAYLNESLSAPYPVQHCQAGNSERGIHLAVLSRFPLRVKSHRDRRLSDEQGMPVQGYTSADHARTGQAEALGLQRDLLEIEIDEQGAEIVLFAVHLKSKAQMPWQIADAEATRAAEARLIAERVQGVMDSGREVMLAGDFNDVPAAPSLAAIDALGLIDVHLATPSRSKRSRSTYWPKRHARIDRILVSAGLAARIVQNSARIHTGDRARRASDHFAVSVDLCFA